MSDNNNLSSAESHPRGQQQYSQPSWPEHVPIPETFLCPLSKKFMNHPVIDREGNSYEREAIFKYLRAREQLGTALVSPVTKNPLQESDLVDNRALQSIIDSALKNALEQEQEAHKSSSSSKKSMSRRFRIVNPLKTRMKAIATMQIASTSAPKETKKILEPMYGEGDSSSSSGSEDESNGASSLSRNDNNKLGLDSIVEDTTIDSQQSKNAVGKHEESFHEEFKAGEAAEMDATPRNNKEKGLDQGVSFVDRFEKRSNQRLSQLPSKSINKRGSTAEEYEERIKKKLSQDAAAVIDRKDSKADEFEEKKKKKLSQVPANSINRRGSTADEFEERIKKKLSQGAADVIDRKDSKTVEFDERSTDKPSQVPANTTDRRGSAALRFEEKMNQKLSKDSKTRTKHERKARKAKRNEDKMRKKAGGTSESSQQKKEEGLQKKGSRGLERDKDRGTTMIKESLVDSTVSEMTWDGSAESSLEDSNISGGTNRSNVNSSLDTSHGSEEGGGSVRLQEERRSKRRGKRNALDEKNKKNSNTTDSWKNYYDLPGERKTQRRGRRNVSDEKIKKSLTGSMISETAEDVFCEDQSSSMGVPVEHCNTKDSLDNSSSESESGSKQEVHYAQVQENRRTQRRVRRNLLDEKIKKSLRSSVVSLMSEDVSRADQISSDRGVEKHSEELDHAQLEVEKSSQEGRRNVLDLDEKIMMPVGGSMVSEIGEDTLSEDQSSSGRSTLKRSNTKHSWGHSRDTRDGPSGSKSGNKEVARHKRAQKERTRKEGDGRSVDADDHTKITVQFGKTFAESRRVSDLTIEERNEDSDEMSITIGPTIHEEHTLENCDDMVQKIMHESGHFNFEQDNSLMSWSDLGGAIVQAEMESIRTRLPAKIPEAPCRTPAKSGSTFTESSRLKPTNKKMTWDDLDKDIERAQFLSMKVTDSEAVKIQVELETYMQAGIFDSEPQTSSRRGARHIIAQRKAKERQEEERRSENGESAPTETLAGKIDSILEVMEGSDKTRFDVLNALKTTKGHREAALGLLLGSKSSSFSNRAAYN